MPIGMSKNVLVAGNHGQKLSFRQRIAGLSQSGGTIYYALDGDGDSVRVHWFNTPGSNEMTFSTGGPIHMFLIGGGGGGGHAGIGSSGMYSNSFVWAGGGGGGGVVEIESYSVSANQTLTFEIGAGGTGGVSGYRGNNGGNTTFGGLTAYGGGGGGGGRTPNNFSGNNGGAGGGASTYGCCVVSVSGSQNGGSGVSGQGYGGGLATGNNGYGGGGGGAGSSGNANNVASNKGVGGSARVIYGRSFGGGGGAGSEAGSNGAAGGGNAGRGAASRTPGGNATNGVDGYGGGGGGGSFYSSGNGFLPGNGGNGGVVVAYKYSGEIPYPEWDQNVNYSEWYGIASRSDMNNTGYSWNGSSSSRANTPGNTTDIVHHLSPGVYYNGNYYAPPSRTGTSITKYNVSSNSFSTIAIPSYTSTQYGFHNSVLGPNGKIYFIPWDAANVVVLDTSNDSISTISGSPGGGCCKWNGGVLANNGVIYTAPGGRTTVARINTSNNTFAESSVTNAGSGEAWYRAGVLAPSGIIYFFPRTATNILKYNPSSLGWSTFGSSMFTGCSLGAWASKISCAFLAPNGKIYAFGASTTAGCKRVIRLDPTDDSLTEISSDYAFGRGCMAPDGKIYFLNSTNFLVFDTETETITENSYTNNPTTGLFPFVSDDGNIYGVPTIGGSPVLRLNENGKKTIPQGFVYSRYNKSSL